MNKDDMPWSDVVNETYDKFKEAIGNEKDFKEWMMAREKVGYRFDKLMIVRLYQIYKKKLMKDNDFVVVIAGREGSGKTTLASQIDAWIDPNFNAPEMCFDFNDAIECFRTHKPASAINIDEGAFSLLSRDAMSVGNKNMIKVFMAIRQKRFFITVCCPDYKALDTYLRNHRVAMIVQILKKGHYIAYTDEAIGIINEVIHIVKKVTKVKVPNGTFWHGTFRKEKPNGFDEESYQLKKSKHVDGFLDQIMKEHGEDPKLIPGTRVMKEMNITADRMANLLRLKQIEGKKVGNRWFIFYDSYQKLMNKGENGGASGFKPPKPPNI